MRESFENDARKKIGISKDGETNVPRVRNRRAIVGIATGPLLISFALVTLAGCSGGGGAIGSVPSAAAVAATPIPAPTATPQPTSVYGSLKDLSLGTGLAGATVTIGYLPDASCAGWAGCGHPVGPTVTTTADVFGGFVLPNVGDGKLFLVASLDPSPLEVQRYAILHRMVTVSSTTRDLGDMFVTKLSDDEANWALLVNKERATISHPPIAPVVVDEYAEESARAEAAAVFAYRYPYADSTELIYMEQYATRSDAPPVRVGGVAAVSSSYQQAQDEFFAERTRCPNGDWTTCPFRGDTAHYINLSQATAVWIGLAETGTFGPGPYNAQREYSGIIANLGS